MKAILASGTTTFRPTLDPRKKRPAAYLESTVDWSTLGADSVRLKRSARRIWFDGGLAYTSNATIEMAGPPAGASIEAALGRQSTHIAIEAAMRASPIRSPQF